MTPREIPALPLLVPLTLLAVAVVLWRLHRRHSLTGARVVVTVIACVYAAGVLDRVLLPFPLGRGTGGIREPWRVWLHLTPFVDVVADPIGIVLNVALFVPLGLLVPVIARTSSWRRVLLTGFLLSLAIETVQFIADVTISRGRVADVDDLIGNTIGTLLGYAVFRLLILIPLLARAAASIRAGRRTGTARAGHAEAVDRA